MNDGPLDFSMDEGERSTCSMHFIDNPGQPTHVRMKVNGAWMDGAEGELLLEEIMEKGMGAHGLMMMMTLAMLLGDLPNAEKMQGEYDG